MTAKFTRNETQSLLRTGQPSAAIDALRELVDRNPTDVMALYQLAVAQASIGATDEAIATYRRVLRLAPGHLKATINLGALQTTLHQHDAAAETLSELNSFSDWSSPTASMPQDSLGRRRFDQGLFADAIAAYRQDLDQQPDNADTWLGLAAAHAALGQWSETVIACERATTVAPQRRELWLKLGSAFSHAQRPADAVHAYRRACDLDPKDADTLRLLAAAQRAAGDVTGAVETYTDIIRLAPRDLTTQIQLVVTLDALGKSAQAQIWFEASLQVIPVAASEYREAFRALLPTDHRERISAFLSTWQAAVPTDRMANYFNAHFQGQGINRATDDYVRAEFDAFAATYDDRLGRLRNRGPDLLRQALVNHLNEGGRALRMLDAGCGTGLCGSILRPLAAHLVGVDISSAMLDQARERALYDELVESELTHFLSTTTQRFDAIACIDTLVYFGDLEEFLRAAWSISVADAWLIFTVESSPRFDRDADFRLHPTGRFSHNRSYVERIVTGSGFGIVSVTPTILREERGEPVEGLVVVARKRSEAPTAPDHERQARQHFEQGIKQAQAGCFQDAAREYEAVIALMPYVDVAYFNLGNCYFELQDFDRAIAAYRRAVELSPEAPTWNNLGNSLAARGDSEAAREAFECALRLVPEFTPALNNLGRVLLEQGAFASAQRCLTRALQQDPRNAATHTRLGDCLFGQGQCAEAIDAYERAHALSPQSTSILMSLSAAESRAGRLQDAFSSLLMAQRIEPENPLIFNNLGELNRSRGHVSEAMFCYLRALQLAPHLAEVHSNRLLTSLYDQDATREWLLEDARSWARCHAARVTPLPPRPLHPDEHRPLRIGYLSADLRNHPVGYFLEPVLKHHDTRAVEVTCYANHAGDDELSRRLQQLGHAWKAVSRLSDDELAEMIRRDEIDILVELGGHTADHRLLTLARRPAPVQATWIGFPGTTGLPHVDYIIADSHLIPPGEQRFYTEQAARMPHSYVCFGPPNQDLTVTSLPAMRTGRVTFGCFNNIAKITPQVIGVWAHVLREVPESRLFLKSRALADTYVREHVRKSFATHQVDPARLRLEGGAPRAEFMTAYQEVDIALDPFPYNGGLTTLEALWMGVPVIALRGDRFASHAGETYLATMQLEDWVAGSVEDYVRLAVEWSLRLPALAELRSQLRERLLRSPLGDTETFTRNLEALFQQMWRTAYTNAKT